MTDYSKRTPGPWAWSDDGYGDECCPAEPGKRWLTIRAAGADEVAVIVNRIEEPTEEQKANAAFIVACENAMTAAGIVNPEAVAEIIEAAKEITTWTRRDRWREEIFQFDIEALRAALAVADAMLAERAKEAQRLDHERHNHLHELLH